jgi:hypothetical protein
MAFRSTGFNRGKSFRAGSYTVVGGALDVEPNDNNTRYLAEFGVYPIDAVPSEVVAFEAQIDAGEAVEELRSAVPHEQRAAEFDVEGRPVG